MSSIAKDTKAAKDKETQDIKLIAVYDRLYDISPKLYKDETEFQESVEKTYGQDSRFFHGIGHLLQMVDQDDAWTMQAYTDLKKAFNKAYHQAGQSLTDQQFQELRDINFIAALGHDFEYNVDGKATEYGTSTLKNYVSPIPGQPEQILDTPVDKASDPIGWATFKIFEQKEGSKLSTFNGQNEFLSALVLAKKLEAAKIEEHGHLTAQDKHFILGVITSVAATIPFSNPEKFQSLRNRVESVAGELELEDPKRIADMLTVNATLLANKDVLTFAGGLFHRNSDLTRFVSQGASDDAIKAATDKLLADLSNADLKSSLAAGDHLTTEEDMSRKLARSTAPGRDYTAHDMLAVSFKRVRLSNMLKGWKDNLFHGVEIGPDGDKVSYPPKEVVTLMNRVTTNEHGTGAVDILTPAYQARVAALSIVHAVGAMGRLQNAELAIFMDGITEETFEESTKLPTVDHLKRAVEVLRDRTHNLHNDIPNSPLATTLLCHIDKPEDLEKAYQIAETQFGNGGGPGKTPENNPGKFFEDLKATINHGLIQNMQDTIAGNAIINTRLRYEKLGIKPVDELPKPEAGKFSRHVKLGKSVPVRPTFPDRG